MIRDAYRRYRAWAARHGQGTMMMVGGCAGLCGALITALMGLEWSMKYFLPWVAAFGGPIAAFDAYGAAEYRGAPREGMVRGVAILLLCWGAAAFAWMWRRQLAP